MGRKETKSKWGTRSIDYLAQGKPCNILPPSERRDLWDVSVDGFPHTNWFVAKKTPTQGEHVTRVV